VEEIYYCTSSQNVTKLTVIIINFIQNFIEYPPYIDDITGDHQCGFQSNRSTTNQIFICQKLEKKWEYNETVHQLLIDLKEAYDSVRKEVLYILIGFEYP
jgi:hypothetical protein